MRKRFHCAAFVSAAYCHLFKQYFCLVQIYSERNFIRVGHQCVTAGIKCITAVTHPQRANQFIGFSSKILDVNNRVLKVRVTAETIPLI